MNRKKLIVLLTASSFVLTGLFPPWFETYRNERFDAGYSAIFKPPPNASIDTPRLFIQWACIAAVGLAGWFLTVRSEHNKPEVLESDRESTLPAPQFPEPIVQQNQGAKSASPPKLTTAQSDALSNQIDETVRKNFSPSNRAEANRLIAERLMARARTHLQEHGDLSDFAVEQIADEEAKRLA